VQVNELVEQARSVARRAHAPYSHFRVGAAVLDADRATYQGCNVESASYGLSMCAERTAIFAAVAAGARHPFLELAVTCPDADAALGDAGRMPCGACRQVMAEHLAPDATITVDGVGTFTIDQLLPRAFEFEP
jgi:cytidine deaminase